LTNLKLYDNDQQDPQTKWDPKLITSAIIEEAGHASFLEKPEEYNKILLDWAKSVAKV